MEGDKNTKKEHGHTPTSGWITKYRKRPGNEWLEEIDRDFLRDYTNLIGLDEEVCYMSQGLHIILSDGIYIDSRGHREIQTKTEDKHFEAAEMVYSLAHARYMLTSKGLEKVLKKYKKGAYGSCPRYYCEKTSVLPMGMSGKFGQGDVKTYCPSCEDAYHAVISSGDEVADGASFGPSFPQVFFMAYPELRPSSTLGRYVGTLYGFNRHCSAEYLTSEPTEVKMSLRSRTKQHRAKPNRKKDSNKESDPEHETIRDKLPEINGNPRTATTKDNNLQWTCCRENTKSTKTEKAPEENHGNRHERVKAIKNIVFTII